MSNSDHVCIASVYYPAGPTNINTEWLNNINSKESWIVTGDFNCHSPIWDKNCDHITNKTFEDNVIKCGLVLLNDGRTTRIPDTSQHHSYALDLTLLTPNLADDSLWDLGDDLLGSDHLPITTTIKSVPDIIEGNDKVPKFSYKLANWAKFKSLLELKQIPTCSDIDDIYEDFTNSILTAANESIPKIRKCKKVNHNGNIWWNMDCDKAINNKKSTYKKWLKSKSEVDFLAMKKAKIDCNRQIAKAKKEYWSNFVEKEISNYSDSHITWKQVSQMKHGYVLPQCPVKLPGKEFPSSQEKAEAFAQMFASVSNTSSLSVEEIRLRNNLENSIKFQEPNPDNEHIINDEIKMTELSDALEFLRNRKSAVGCDGISYTLLNNLPLKWMKYLLSLFQKCWQNGIVPKIWKVSIIVPILKAGKSRSDIASYRPIALTSHTSKLMEKIILNRLVYFCDKNDIIPGNQAGFRKGRSITDHLVKLSTNIKQQFSKKKGYFSNIF